MRISYDAAAPRPAADVWASLTDIDRVLDTLPGSSLTRNGAAAAGSVKCRLRDGQVTYRVVARAEIAAIAEHTAVVAVSGTEARGNGTLAASLTVAVRDNDAGGSRLEVTGDLDATGRGAAASGAEWERLVRSQVSALLPHDVSSEPAANGAAPDDTASDDTASETTAAEPPAPAAAPAPRPVARPSGASVNGEPRPVGVIAGVAAAIAVLAFSRHRLSRRIG